MCKTGVYANYTTQLTAAQRSRLLKEALTYVTPPARTNSRAPTASEYLSYKKARLIAGSTTKPQVHNPSILVTQLQAIGC